MIELSCTSNNTYCIQRYGVTHLPLDNLNDSDLVVNAIKTLLLHEHIQSKRAVLAVPDTSAIRKIIQISMYVPKNDIEAWVYQEAEKYIPYSLNDITLDFSVLGVSRHGAEWLDVLVVASRVDHVQKRVDVIQHAGLDVDIVDVESFAIERAARFCSPGLSLHSVEKYTALLEINEEYLRCFVFYEDSIIFSREDAFADGVTAEFTSSVLPLIQRALQFFSLSCRNAIVTQLVLAGSLARSNALVQCLRSSFNVPIYIANPFNNMMFSTPRSRKRVEEDAPMLMIACGLALRQ